CHDGVYLSREEADGVRDTVDAKRAELEAEGAKLPEKVVVYGNWRNQISGPKTATFEHPMDRTALEYPEHFANTRCVFLLEDSRCSLQALAMAEGKQPWFYKPLTCWLHPLSITRRRNQSVLTLYSEETDPQRYPDYDGFVCRTHCGRTCKEGPPAWQVLRDELDYLGQCGGRDLIKEIVDSL
ncbi:MAG: hypothetical protein AAF226_13555, partial [Verrucomicrobiota bacterium]